MILYVDGGCSGNGSKDIASRKMISVVTNAGGKVLSERETVGGSNNIAEFIAVRDALQCAVSAGMPQVTVYTDSKNNIAWVLGRKVGKKLNDKASVLSLKMEIQRLRNEVTLTLVWLPREKNIAGHYIEQRYAL